MKSLHNPSSLPTQQAPSSWRWFSALSLCSLLWFGLAIFVGQLSSCSAPNPTETTLSDSGTTTEKPATRVQPKSHPRDCHPYAQGLPQGACLLPYPSSYYLKQDSSSETGFRVTYPNLLPSSDNGDTKTKADPTFFNRRDGFSPATPLLALFAQRVDPKTLINKSQTARSLEPTSPVQLIEFGTQQRIPLLAEVDQTVDAQSPQVVIVRPLVRLKPKQRYVVVFLNTVKGLDGKELEAPAAFRSLWSGNAPETPEETALSPGIQEIQRELESAKISKNQVLLAWDFTTASDAPLLDEMLHMRKTMFEATGPDGPTYTFTKKFTFSTKDNENILYRWQGQMMVPSFLSKDDFGGLILRDEQDKPKIREKGSFFFQVQIPHCATTQTKPLPLLVFGHGLFGGATRELGTGYLERLAQRFCMVQIAHNWRGLSELERGSVAIDVPTNIDNMPKMIHLLQQAHINAVAMIRMALKRFPQDKDFQINGKPILDGNEVYYLGISNGAIQGGTLMALTPDIQRGILNVGGANWSMLMSRSADFGPLSTLMKTYYKDPVEQQLTLALFQPHFDIVDPFTYAPYLLKDPKRLGVPAKTILLQEAIGDAQVPNLTTRSWVRTLGLTALEPLFEPVFGINTKAAPLPQSGYVQFGPRPTPVPPNGNLPIPRNSQHNVVRQLEGAVRQMQEFFQKDGTIQHFCKGPCDPD